VSKGDLKPTPNRKDYFYPSTDLSDDARKARAERAAHRRAAQMEDAPRAMADYRAAEAAVRSRTERLRAARLAQQATEVADCEGGQTHVAHSWAVCVINAEDCRVKAEHNPKQREKWLLEAERWEDKAEQADR
jgi:hypothetical protein